MRVSIRLLVLFMGFLTLWSCRDYTKEELDEMIDENTVSQSFKFKTTATQSVSILAHSNNGKPFKGVPVSISIPITEDSFALVFKGHTNNKGILETELELDLNVSHVLVTTNYIGLPGQHYIRKDLLYGLDISQQGTEVPGVSFPVFSNKRNTYTSKYAYLGTWDSKGVPKYKKHQRDVISQSMLNDINSSLPEYKPVPTFNAQYLANGVETNTKVIEKADVWVTFVHEGAGYKNVLGYYTYPIDTPPSSIADIDDLNIIFPNASYQGLGGGLVSGDKVHLGQFEAGIAIGWFLVANGYSSSSNSVGSGNWIVFSDPVLNPESNPALKQHMVQLYDETRDLIILGFEDIRRDNGGCDNDFNDAIFYVTANPIEAIERSNLEAVKKSVDSDGDGVLDFDDEFPYDPGKSAVSYSPSVSTNGSLCFEDNWPNMGDYDFNDLVVDYNYTYYTNGSNELTELKAEYTMRAIGASMHNGFGVQFEISPDKIKSVDGCEYTENYINLSSNGTEAGQNKATIIVFDDAHKHMQRAGNGKYVNTDDPSTVVAPVKFTVIVKFNNGVNPTDLGKSPYNCFLVSNGNRGREVHMVDYQPTDLANTNLFQTAADNSEPEVRRYYQNKDNMPWVLHTPQTLVYPLEKTNIYECYPYFDDWAKSEGRSYTDWYQDKSGYRVNSKLFNP